MVECKSAKGGTFPFSNLRQYERLLSYDGRDGVFPAVVVWFVEKDAVIWAPIASVKAMKAAGKKSIGFKDAKEGSYNLVDVPSVKKRVFMDSDYSVVTERTEGGDGH